MSSAPAGRSGDTLSTTVTDLVARQLPGAVRPDPDAPLREAGLDSLRTVATLVAIEEEFGIQLPDELVSPETFHSVRTLTTAVASLVGPGPAADATDTGTAHAVA